MQTRRIRRTALAAVAAVVALWGTTAIPAARRRIDPGGMQCEACRETTDAQTLRLLPTATSAWPRLPALLQPSYWSAVR